jgi:hypothetical protein
MDNRKLSQIIRDKKKKLAESDPELVGTSPVPDMNAQDVWDTEKRAYVETMTDSPPKINADQTMLDEPGDEAIKKMQDARMGRLRAYMSTLDIY